MILRRMAEAIREQNWFTVIIEILIVVIGIFLGLQVTEWNDGLKEKARAKQYQNRLIVELGDDQAELQLRVNYMTRVLENGELLLDNLEIDQSGSLDAQWITVRSAFQASQIWPFEIASIAYGEIQTNGSIHLIGDVSLINDLANYYGRGNTQIQQVAGTLPPYRTVLRGLLPWDLQSDMWSRCLRSDDYGSQELLECERPAQTNQIPLAIEAIKQSKELPFLLRQWMSDVRVRLILYQNTLNGAQLLIEALKDSQ